MSKISGISLSVLPVPLLEARAGRESPACYFFCFVGKADTRDDVMMGEVVLVKYAGDRCQQVAVQRYERVKD